MKQPKCNTCQGRGHYIAVVPPGRDVKAKCFCGGPKTQDQSILRGTVMEYTHYHKDTGELVRVIYQDFMQTYVIGIGWFYDKYFHQTYQEL